MAKSRVGLDIGSTAVRAAEVAQGDRPSVTRLGQVPLPPGAVEAGEVREVAVVSAALERLSEVSGVAPGPVYLGFASSKVVVREVTLPWIPEKELREALAFQVAEYIPMAPDEAVLDFHPLDEGTGADGQRTRRILLVAAQKAQVLASVDAARGAGFEPISVDLAPFAAVRSASGEGSGLEAVVDIGGQVTCIALHRASEVELVRILATGGSEVTRRMASDLGVEPLAAELLKRGEGDDQLPTGVDRGRIRSSAMQAAAGLVDEIASTIEFSLRQFGGGTLDRITMTGGGSHLEGIVELLDERVPGVEVDRARIFGRARSRLAPELGAMAEAGRAFSVAIGLALPDESRTANSGQRRRRAEATARPASDDAPRPMPEQRARGRFRRRAGA